MSRRQISALTTRDITAPGLIPIYTEYDKISIEGGRSDFPEMLDPKVDLVFKRIFGAEETKAY